MPFGQHKGVLMQDVPTHYLHWCWSNMVSVEGKDSARVIDYIKRSLAALKQENPDLIWERKI